MATQLFHLALPADWESAQERGVYDMSTRGATRDQVGFIHLSFAHQWPQVRAAFYADVEDLLLLEVDPAAVADPIVVEIGNPQTGEQFPHLYGPLPTRAVVRVERLGREA